MKNRNVPPATAARFLRLVLPVLTCSTAVLSLAACSSPIPLRVDDRANGLLLAMADRLASAETLAITGRRTIDAGLIEGQTTSESADLTVTVSRQDGYFAKVVGEDHERHDCYDGKTFTIVDARENCYATLDAAGSLDKLAVRLAEDFGYPLPMAEFVVARPYAFLTEKVIGGEYVGTETVKGETLHHLAFYEEALDWDLWISASDLLPRAIAVTAIAVEGEPLYVIRDIRVELNPTVPKALFDCRPPAGARKVDILRADAEGESAAGRDERSPARAGPAE